MGYRWGVARCPFCRVFKNICKQIEPFNSIGEFLSRYVYNGQGKLPVYSDEGGRMNFNGLGTRKVTHAGLGIKLVE